MVQQSQEFNEYVKKNILASNKFGITKVAELTSVKSLVFQSKDYQQIEQFVKDENFELIMDSTDTSLLKEYLEVMRFIDQNGNRYIVTVYDSDEMWQDPEVIKIYPSRL